VDAKALARRSPLFGALSTTAPSPASSVESGPSFLSFQRSCVEPPPRPITQAQVFLNGFTEEGRDTLARILRRTLERNGVTRGKARHAAGT
jgi:hypothetical protein